MGLLCESCRAEIPPGKAYIFMTRPLLPIEERLWCADGTLDGKAVCFVIALPPVTKKNSPVNVPIRRKGKADGKVDGKADGKGQTGAYMPLPSKPYRKYEPLAAAYCPPLGIDYPVNVKATYYMATRRKVDIANLHSALHDVLVKHGTLKDDNCRILVSTDGSRVRYDKDNPRTEVVITPALPEDVQFLEELFPH
jgi:Holliday junction resolvase RusA-like endonuclease